jgi:hypothetical protein
LAARRSYPRLRKSSGGKPNVTPAVEKLEAAFDGGLFSLKTFERIPSFYLKFWVWLSSLSMPIPGTVLPTQKDRSFETFVFAMSRRN